MVSASMQAKTYIPAGVFVVADVMTSLSADALLLQDPLLLLL